jgi:F-box and leucine-rich repeat protein 2/20
MSMLLSAGPFLRHLNLRGCAQLRSTDIFALATRATNLVSLSLEGCPILDSMCLEVLLSRNPSLRTLDLSGLKGMTDKVATEIATHCIALERLDLGWCANMTCSGLYDIVSFCKGLKRLRICDNPAFAGPFIRKLLMALHYLDKLEVLVLSGCRDLVDNSLRILFRGSQDLAGADEPVRILPLRQLNLSRIVNLTDTTLRNLAGVVPHLQKLELAGSSNGTAFTNAGFAALLPTIPKLTHLDLEDNHHITDATLHLLASLPIADSLVHLQLSYCLEITDAGIIRILQHCIHLRNLEVDNTQAGDGMLMEAPRLIARRAASSSSPRGLRIVAYDCGAISWVGVSEILAQNLHFARTHNICRRDSNVSDFHKNYYSSPVPIIRMKCTFEWQKLVDAHTRRCLRGEYAAAEQIALGFSRWMMEEAEEGAWGGNARRRRRRAMGFAEHGEDAFVMGVGRRRLRAFSAPSSCLVM